MRGAKIFKKGNLYAGCNFLCRFMSQFNAAANTNKINILTWPVQQLVAHIAANSIGFQLQFICRFGNFCENRVCKIYFKVCAHVRVSTGFKNKQDVKRWPMLQKKSPANWRGPGKFVSISGYAKVTLTAFNPFFPS